MEYLLYKWAFCCKGQMGFLDFLIGCLKVSENWEKEWKTLEKPHTNHKFAQEFLQYLLISSQFFAQGHSVHMKVLLKQIFTDSFAIVIYVWHQRADGISPLHSGVTKANLDLKTSAQNYSLQRREGVECRASSTHSQNEKPTKSTNQRAPKSP